jgi:hypothetical protein
MPPLPSSTISSQSWALTAADGPSSGRAGKFFYALGPAWRLTAAQRSRLTPAVLAALDEGWTPQQLARFAGRTPTGSGIRTRCWPSGSRLPNCPRRPASGLPGRHGAASATSARGWPASTATRRTPARAATRRPAHSRTAPAQTARTACTAILRNGRALEPGRPGAAPSHRTTKIRQVPSSTRTRSVHAGSDNHIW